MQFQTAFCRKHERKIYEKIILALIILSAFVISGFVGYGYAIYTAEPYATTDGIYINFGGQIHSYK